MKLELVHSQADCQSMAVRCREVGLELEEARAAAGAAALLNQELETKEAAIIELNREGIL